MIDNERFSQDSYSSTAIYNLSVLVLFPYRSHFCTSRVFMETTAIPFGGTQPCSTFQRDILGLLVWFYQCVTWSWMQIITNGIYKSAQHRAITNADKARLSVATFHDPAKTMPVSPAFTPPRYRQVVYGDYVSSWYTKGPNGKRNIDALLI